MVAHIRRLLAQATGLSLFGLCQLHRGLQFGNRCDESTDSLRSRGLASDYDGTDIYVSLHSNGSTGDCAGTGCPNGTCTYYDTSTEHATWGAISRTLATKINTAIVNAIRTRYSGGRDTDTTWRDRGSARRQRRPGRDAHSQPCRGFDRAGFPRQL